MLSFVIISSPIISLLFNLLSQSFIYRLAFTNNSYLKTLTCGFILGLLFQLLLISLILNLTKDLWIIISLLWIYICLSFCLFGFANLGQTSIRIKILRMITIEPLDTHELLLRYNNDYLFDKRVERLLASKQIYQKNGYYFIRKSLLIKLNSLLLFLKLIYTGKSTEFETDA